MAFVNEYIPEDDIQKYEIAKWDKNFVIGHYKPSWTVDRDRDVYLRYMSNGREDYSNHWTFCFYWHGHVLQVELIVSGGGQRRGDQWSSYELKGLMQPLFKPLPAALEAYRQEILADLKEALIAFKEFGVLSNSTAHVATFKFSDTKQSGTAPY